MKRMKYFAGSSALILSLILAGGCTTKSEARLQAQNAYLAGQNTVLQQHQVTPASTTVTIIGPVQNPQVPWVAGLTLVQALATANYQDQRDPKQIIITRDGESATLDANVLFNGTVVPLEAGDVVELRQ
ncbi:MAG TPA: hypothetical protein VGO57_07645 [Verrucomicrobiae bacterium]|jgi:phosphoribosyl-dephospho-CoA transferase